MDKNRMSVEELKVLGDLIFKINEAAA